MGFFNTNKSKKGYLYISYLMTEQRILKVWRIDPEEQAYTLKEFITAQMDNIDIESFIPQIRIYQFNYQDIHVVPLISYDNSHFKDFVSRKEPEINISLLEGIFQIRQGIEPIVPITEKSPNLEAYHAFLDEQDKKEDMLRWEQEIIHDSQSTDYDLLANLVLKYEHQPQITEKQIELLNTQNTALRIFHTLREYFDQTDFIRNGWDLDNFEYLIHVPANQRTPLHIIRAELFKMVDFEYDKNNRYPDKDKKIFELNIFLSALDVVPDWENHPIPEEWKLIACSCMTDADATADAIVSFQYIPAITEEQINYLVRTGTVPSTFVHSGIMGNVFIKTPLFKTRYGLFLECFKNSEPSAMDNLIIDSLKLMATEAMERFKLENPNSPQISTIEKTIIAVNNYRRLCERQKAKEIRERNLNQLEQYLNKIANDYKELDHEETLIYDEEYLEDLIRGNHLDTELSECQCNILIAYLPRIPAEVTKKLIPVFKGQEYGKLPVHQDISSIEGIEKAIKIYGITPLHKLALYVEKQRLDESISASDKEIDELQRQIHRANERITLSETELEKKKRKRLELKTLINNYKS